MDCNHPWAAPGDAVLANNQLLVGECRLDITNEFRCLAVFLDCSVWEIRGLDALYLLFQFADLEYALLNDRAQLELLGAQRLWPPKS